MHMLAEGTKDGQTLISVCVCTHNRAKHLRETLDSLLAVLPSEDDIEILVVDNASTDDTPDVVGAAAVRDRRIRHLFEPYPGVARARNTALRLARGSIIVCIDDDVRPQGGWLEALTKPIKAGTADAVAGRIVLAADVTQPWMTKFFRVRLAESLSNRDQHAPLISANMALSAEVARAVRFDEELGPGQLGMSDDVLFDYHVQAAQFRVVPADDAVVFHALGAERLERGAMLALARANGRSDAYVWRHWLHTDLGWLRLRLTLASAQWLRLRLGRRISPISEDLYEATYRIEFIRRLRLERRRRARYQDASGRKALQSDGRELRSGESIGQREAG
jgi:glycosyltransferase involved in cell wall biosynthesis